MLLDEAMSSVDSRTEALIEEVLQEHLKESTVVKISHRLDTFKGYKRVFKFSEGEVTEE